MTVSIVRVLRCFARAWADIGVVKSLRSQMVPSVCDEYTVTVFGTEGGSASAALYANLERFLIHQPYFWGTFSASVIYRGERRIRRQVTHKEEERDGHAHGRQRGEDAHRPLVAQGAEHVWGQ